MFCSYQGEDLTKKDEESEKDSESKDDKKSEEEAKNGETAPDAKEGDVNNVKVEVKEVRFKIFLDYHVGKHCISFTDLEVVVLSHYVFMFFRRKVQRNQRKQLPLMKKMEKKRRVMLRSRKKRLKLKLRRK